jgi:hypothetical protein
MKNSGMFDLSFLQIIAYDKKNTYNYKWKINHCNDPKALTDRKMISIVIKHKDKGARSNTYEHKKESSEIFPFPGNNKQSRQDKSWDKMQGQTSKLLPNSITLFKGIGCKHTNK